MIQIHTFYGVNQKTINEELRLLQQEHPKWEIKNISLDQAEPTGWFVTIVYDFK